MKSRLAAVVRLVWFWALVVCIPTWALAQEEGQGQFLLISDIHFDPFYDGSLFGQLQAQPVEKWPEILEESKPAGFNPRGTDSNYALVKSSLDEVQKRLPDPDFILYPGDLMAHEWQSKYDRLAPKSHLEDPEAYHDFTTRAIRFLAREFQRRYPDTPVLPTLGNDDSYCGDYMITPDGPFLAMYAEVWAPLIGPEKERERFRKTFSHGGYFTTKLPGAKHHRLVVLNSIVFSVNYDNACGTSTQTPALDQLEWLGRTLDEAREAGETVWLLMHIPPGINSYNSAESVLHDGPAVTFWQPELTSRFLQLVGRHRDTIQGAFLGHTHMDDFRVIRLDGRPILFGKIAPAISPIFGNNPGYQGYQYDRETGVLLNYQTYYLTNLADNDNGAPPPAAPEGKWAFEYDFQKTYQLPSLDPASIARLAGQLRANAAYQKSYTQFYSVSAAPEFDPRTFDVYACAIPNVTPAEFLNCLHGVPKPRHPIHFPDRRRAPAPTP